MTTRTLVLGGAVLVAASMSVSSSAEAQWRRGRQHYTESASEQTISYMVGYAILDDGVSVDSLARPWGVRIDAPIAGRILVGEVGLSGLSTKTDIGGRERFLIPEGQIQLQLPLGPFRPYVGIGGGYVIGRHDTGAALEGNMSVISTSIGLRTFLAGDRLTLNVEGRGRQYGRDEQWTSGEFTAGVGVRF
jgi:opacity protein-like surface antigen